MIFSKIFEGSHQYSSWHYLPQYCLFRGSDSDGDPPQRQEAEETRQEEEDGSI